MLRKQLPIPTRSSQRVWLRKWLCMDILHNVSPLPFILPKAATWNCNLKLKTVEERGGSRVIYLFLLRLFFSPCIKIPPVLCQSLSCGREKEQICVTYSLTHRENKESGLPTSAQSWAWPAGWDQCSAVRPWRKSPKLSSACVSTLKDVRVVQVGKIFTRNLEELFQGWLTLV